MNSSEIQPPVSDRIRIGECIVTLSSREVEVVGARRPRRLTPKALGVLRVLLRQPGRVVTRDELFAEVWPDTLPTNDVLTQAVTQLRKAFSNDDDSGQAYIETIAKTGYRLLVPVQALDDAEPSAAGLPDDEGVDVQPALAAAAVLPARANRPPLAPCPPPRAAGAGRVDAGHAAGDDHAAAAPRTGQQFAGGGRRGERHAGDRQPQRPYRLITATSGFETYPTLSPDGSLVAYEGANEDGNGGGAIKVQTSGNAPARQLLAPPAGAVDRFPNWSPDGREIAFARFSADAGCQVLIASATGGALRQATRCDGTELLSFDWTPDGRGLVFGSMVGRYAHRGIRVLDLASGQWRALAYSVDQDDFDYAPRYSPDGQWLVFVRNPQLGDLWRVPAAGGKPEQLTNEAAELRGWAWLDDGRTIVFGRRVDSEARLYYLDVERHTLRDAGLDDAQWPAVSRRGGMGLRPPARAVRRVQGAGAGQRRRTPVCIQWPRWAADGSAGWPPAGLHLGSLRQLRPVVGGHAAPDSLRPIEGLRPEARQAPDWSADSRQLLVVGRAWAHGGLRSRHAMNACNLCRSRPNSRCRPVWRVAGAVVCGRARCRPAHPVESVRPQHQPGAGWPSKGCRRRASTAVAACCSPAWPQVACGRPTPRCRRAACSRSAMTGPAAGDTGPGPWPATLASVTSALRARVAPPSCASCPAARAGTLPGCGTAQRNGLSASADGRDLFVAMAVSDGADIGVMRLPERPRAVPGVLQVVVFSGNGPS